jgi:general stress protein 26
VVSPTKLFLRQKVLPLWETLWERRFWIDMSALATQPDKEFLKKLRGLLKDIEICMLTTHAGISQFRSRPMALQDVDFEGDLWFFCSMNSRKIGEIARDPHVSVTASNPSKSICIALGGTASTIRDVEKMHELWRPTYKLWFPKGLEDPELSLLKVEVREAEYWEWASGVASSVVQLIKSWSTGDEEPLSQHERRIF